MQSIKRRLIQLETCLFVLNEEVLDMLALLHWIEVQKTGSGPSQWCVFGNDTHRLTRRCQDERTAQQLMMLMSLAPPFLQRCAVIGQHHAERKLQNVSRAMTGSQRLDVDALLRRRHLFER